MLDSIIDIHCHILPEIDDGPDSWEESLNMIRQAVRQGVREIIATPHYILGEIEYEKSVVLDKVQILQKKVIAEGLDCTIYPGMELYLMPQLIKHFEEEKILTLAGSKYVLIEFPNRDVTSNLINLLHEIKIRGYYPVIAHPERNISILNKPCIINELLEHRILFQINANSLTGGEGVKVQRLGMDLIKQGLASFIASDAHSTKRRPFKTAEVLGNLKHSKNASLLNEAFYNNGRKVIGNIEITNEKNYSIKSGIVNQIKEVFRM